MGKKRVIFGDRPPSFVSKATLAAEFEICETTVDEWVRRGTLPKPIRVGGSVRWNWGAVVAAMSANNSAPDGDPFMKGVANVS